jgi:diacylglycerol O-acyltransferase
MSWSRSSPTHCAATERLTAPEGSMIFCAMGATASGGAVVGSSADRGESLPLTNEDLSILALESATVAGHSCKVIMLEERIDPDALRASIASRLDRAPLMSLCLSEVRGEPCWVPAAELDLNAQVVEAGGAEPLDLLEFRKAVAKTFQDRLDRSRPLWRIDVIPKLTWGGTALIWRIHHALADGFASMQMARGALWDEEPPPDGPQAGSGRPGSATRHQRIAHDRLAALRVAMREAPQPWVQSPFGGRIGADREVAFASVELQGLRDAAHIVDGATLNDAVLAVVAGGLHRWLEEHHGRLGTVRVKVPVSLHQPAAAGHEQGVEPGNRDSFFCLDLPVGPAEPLERLATIQRETRARKDGHDAQLLDGLMRELAKVPALRELAERALSHPRSFALNVSNVIGPRRPCRVLGSRVNELYSLAEIREQHALRVSVVSLCDSLNFGLVADPTLLGDVAGMAADMEAEATALVAQVKDV